MNKDAAHSRLLQAIEYLKDNGMARNHEEISGLSGVCRPNVTAAINGNFRYVTEGFIKRFARAYAEYINEDWLLSGVGKMEKSDKKMRPHYPATVEAGILGGDVPTTMNYEVEMEPVIKHFPDYDYMIDVSGRSMEPAYFDGDIVACRKLYERNEIVPGNVYVIATQDGAVIKRIVSTTLSSLRVASDNPDYKPYNIDFNSVISIALVVGSIHNEQKSQESFQKAMLKLLEDILTTKKEDSLDDVATDIANQIIEKLKIDKP